MDQGFSHTQADNGVLHRLELLMQHELFGGIRLDADKQGVTNRALHQYCPLLHKSIIRLFTLAPGKSNEALRGVLRYAPLKHITSYEALSYAWGSQIKPHNIFLENSHSYIPITASLHAALLRLREPTTSRVLWIDAVCINQADDEEKSIQVAIMNQIFSSASRVLGWIGEDRADHDAPKTFQLLERLRTVTFQDLPSRPVTRSFMLSKNLPDQGDPVWFAVRRFFEHSWFRRGWIVQEVVLGHDVLLICGDAQMSLRDMITGVDALLEYSLISWGTVGSSITAMAGAISFKSMLTARSLRTSGGFFAEFSRTFVHGDKEAYERLDWDQLGLAPLFPNHLRELMPKLYALQHATGWTQCLGELYTSIFLHRVKAAAGVEVPVGQTWLIDLIMALPFSVTTDPRDGFYTKLHLSSEKDEPSLQPDYTESVSSTFLRFARYFLFGSKEPDGTRQRNILTFTGSAYHAESEDLPSWAPGRMLHQGPPQLSPGALGQMGYYASGNAESAHRSTQDEREIVVVGGLFDIVSHVVPQPHFPPASSNLNDLMVYYDFFQEIDRLILHRKTPYPRLAPGETHLDVQWRTLIGDRDLHSQLIEDDGRFRESYIQDRRRLGSCGFLEQQIGGEGVLSYPSPLGDLGQRWLQMNEGGYSVCETEKGLVGLVPKKTRIGDSVYIILGENLPCVLRAEKNDSIKYSLIGACYVHGVMQGEALQSEDWSQRDLHLV